MIIMVAGNTNELRGVTFPRQTAILGRKIKVTRVRTGNPTMQNLTSRITILKFLLPSHLIMIILWNTRGGTRKDKGISTGHIQN